MQRFRQSAPTLLVVAVLVATIALSDFASGRAWMAGEHATPAQLALHFLYESLGQHDHHGHASTGAPDTISVQVVPGGIGPVLMASPPATAMDAGQTAQVQHGHFERDVVSLTTLARLLEATRARPVGPAARVPDPPPQPVA